MKMKLLLFLFFNYSFIHLISCLFQNEIDFLFQLYSQNNGFYWTWKLSGPIWNFSVPFPNPCSTNGEYWQGITCSRPSSLCSNMLITYQDCHIIYLDFNT